MPRSSCDVCCNPVELARSVDTYRGGVLLALCAILDAVDGGPTSIRYDYELLCAPVTGDPVLLRFAYSTDGTVVNPPTAYNTDGTAYVGAIADLVSCGSGSSLHEMTPLYSSTDFSILTNAYAIVLTNTNQAVFIKLENLTDADILISTDNVSDWIHLSPGATDYIDLGSNGVYVIKNIFAKYETVAPTTGRLIVSGSY